ncbi:unnamed protein product [Brassica napus]|uniref:(rape) hypothetical protein n=1 Tax=Brassica napus TaxID=3708 RepID=A0A816K753_BRANA|nr:unnamed protein product [Brassica napus]
MVIPCNFPNIKELTCIDHERVERESRSKIGSDERPARECACRRRNPSSNRKDVGLSLLFRFLCPPACLSSGSGPIPGGSASGLKARSCGGEAR